MTSDPEAVEAREALREAIDDALTAWVNDPGYDSGPFLEALAADGFVVSPAGPEESREGPTAAGRDWAKRHALHGHETCGCPFETRSDREWAEAVDEWRVRAINAEALATTPAPESGAGLTETLRQGMTPEARAKYDRVAPDSGAEERLRVALARHINETFCKYDASIVSELLDDYRAALSGGSVDEERDTDE